MPSFARWLAAGLSLLAAAAASAQTAPAFSIPAKQIDVLFGKTLQRTKRVLIPTIHLEVMNWGKISSVTQTSALQTLGGASNSSARSTMEVAVPSDVAAYRQVADEIHADLTAKLRAAGWTVITYADAKSDPELLLKFLLSRGSFTGTLSQIKQLAEKRAEKIGKQMMGELINPLIKIHTIPFDSSAEQLPESNEDSISFNLTFHHTDEDRAAFQKQLEALVADRNELVHHALSHFQLDSVEGCQATCTVLQSQRDRIIPVRDKLKKMVQGLTDMKEIMTQLSTKLRPSPPADPPTEYLTSQAD